MTRNELKILLKSIVMNDSLTDQNYYDNIMNALHKHLDIKNKPITSIERCCFPYDNQKQFKQLKK